MRNPGRKYIKDAEELNITAFMNLMVILVPFLLITAVFSRMTVLELNLPGINSKQETQKKVKLSLELVLKKDGFDVQDSNLGLIKHFERVPGATRWDQFDKVMLEIKRRFPKEQSITLLVEPNVDYKTLIKTMDHVRSTDVVVGASVSTVKLFPDISIGNAEPSQAAINNKDNTKPTALVTQK
jgi:biopolymer transport protein ExbD